MTHHHLKIWPQFYCDIASGRRKHELRVNDRDYQVGDRLSLAVWDPVQQRFTGVGIDVTVTHVFAIADLDARIKSELGLNPCIASVNELVILSIDPVSNETATGG